MTNKINVYKDSRPIVFKCPKDWESLHGLVSVAKSVVQFVTVERCYNGTHEKATTLAMVVRSAAV